MFDRANTLTAKTSVINSPMHTRMTHWRRVALSLLVSSGSVNLVLDKLSSTLWLACGNGHYYTVQTIGRQTAETEDRVATRPGSDPFVQATWRGAHHV